MSGESALLDTMVIALRVLLSTEPPRMHRICTVDGALDATQLDNP